MARHLSNIVQRDLRINAEPDHVYIDFSIVNNQPNGASVPLIFTDLRTQAVLTNPVDYYATVCRFHIDTFASLPVILPQVQLGQSNPNLTVYSFTLEYDGSQAQEYLIFTPENLSEQTPKAPTLEQDMTSKYYYVSSYSYFVGMLNATLTSCYNALKELNSETPDTIAPFLLYDAESGSLIFNADSTHYDVVNTATPIKIYCNPQMRNLLSSFEWLNYGTNAPNGMNYMLNIYSTYGTNILELPTLNVLSAYEEYNSIINWCPIDSLAISSQNLPIHQTIISNPVDFNSTTSMNVNSNNVTLPLLTDFTVPLTTGKEWLPSVDYTAIQYRLIDLFGHSPIQNIQLFVIWKDIYGNSHQLDLPSGGSANLKLLFRTKTFGNR
jgi:hypothetical protein